MGAGERADHGTETDCPQAPHGCHEPDFTTLHIEWDGGELYLDVNCMYCGRSGCLSGPKGLAELSERVEW